MTTATGAAPRPKAAQPSRSRPAGAAKPAAAAAAKAPISEADAAPALRNKELIDLAVERSGVRKKFAKPAIDAAIEILSEAIFEGRELHLPSLGKVKVQRGKDVGGVRISMVKIRQSRPEAGGDDKLGAKAKETVAEASEER